jgi:ADP-heptose:LPS heptosyltransferase
MHVLETYPKLKITVLTKPFFAPIFEHLERVDVVKAEVKSSHRGISGLWLLAKELHRLDIDGVADLHNVLRSRILCGFLKLLGHDYYRLDKGRADKKALTRAKNKVFKPLKTSHVRYLDVFKRLKLPVDRKTIELKRTRLPLSSEIITALNLDTTKTWVGIAPFAAHAPKQYPLEKIEEVLSKLNDENEVQILLFGGGKAEGEKLNALSSRYNNCQSIVGKLTFHEELQLISNLNVMLSMDSGNGHLAAMFGVKVITIWGATHPYAGFAPFGQTPQQQILADIKKYPLLPTSIYGNKQIKGYENVMADIPSEEVYQKLKSSFSSSKD